MSKHCQHLWACADYLAFVQIAGAIRVHSGRVGEIARNAYPGNYPFEQTFA